MSHLKRKDPPQSSRPVREPEKWVTLAEAEAELTRLGYVAPENNPEQVIPLDGRKTGSVADLRVRMVADWCRVWAVEAGQPYPEDATDEDVLFCALALAKILRLVDARRLN